MTKGRKTTYEEVNSDLYPLLALYLSCFSFTIQNTTLLYEEVSLSGVGQEYLYRCVQETNQDGYAVSEICDILERNRSSYYKWIHRAKSRREQENEALLHDIGLLYAEHNGTYGYR